MRGEGSPIVRATLEGLTAGTVVYGVTSAGEWSASASALRRLLSKTELSRADRYRVPEKGVEFTVSRAAQRCALGALLGIPPAVVEIDEGEGSKPRLGSSLAGRGIDFNASHSAGRIAIAMAIGRRVGIDVEEFRAINQEVRFAEMILSASELTIYRGQEEAARSNWLVGRWTAKEAYLKGVGRGLAESLSAMGIVEPPEGSAGGLAGSVAPTHFDAGTWTLHRLEAPTGFVLTLAAEATATPLVIERFDAGELLAAAYAGGVGAQER